jgi:hypothetical protein
MFFASKFQNTGEKSKFSRLMSQILQAIVLIIPNFQAILKAILRDEMISWFKKTGVTGGSLASAAPSQGGTPATGEEDCQDREAIVMMVTKAVNSIVQRLQSLSSFDGTESKVSIRGVFLTDLPTSAFQLIYILYAHRFRWLRLSTPPTRLTISAEWIPLGILGSERDLGLVPSNENQDIATDYY